MRWCWCCSHFSSLFVVLWLRCVCLVFYSCLIRTGSSLCSLCMWFRGNNHPVSAMRGRLQSLIVSLSGLQVRFFYKIKASKLYTHVKYLSQAIAKPTQSHVRPANTHVSLLSPTRVHADSEDWSDCTGLSARECIFTGRKLCCAPNHQCQHGFVDRCNDISVARSHRCAFDYRIVGILLKHTFSARKGNEPRHDKPNKMSVHPCGRRRLWSDWADLSLR